MATMEINTAPAILFEQASREQLAERARFMVPLEGGEWQPVSWARAAARVQRLAAFLMERGVDRDVKVAVLGNTRLEWGLAGLALQAAGGTLVPVYPTLKGEQLGHILGHSDARVLVVESSEQLERVLALWEHLDIHTVVTMEPLDARLPSGSAWSLERAEQEGAARLERGPGLVLERTRSIDLDQVASLIYTSGTTGPPKGVMLTHRNVGINGADWIEVNGPLLRDQDVDLLWLPMSHVFGWGEFCLGNQLGLVTHFSAPAQVLDQLPRVRPQVFMSVPAYWDKLAALARLAGESEPAQLEELRRLTGGRLRFCLSGGAGLSRQVKDFFLKAGMLIIEGYGLTECSPTLTMNHHDDYDFDTVGKPFPSVQLKLAADGEILARGQNVFSGYYKDAQSTRETFDAEGWFCTGDLGRFTDRGFVQIVGRKKEILVTAGGKNVPPQNIELRFKEDPLIAHLVVYGDGKKYLTALVDIDEAQALRRLAGAGSPPGDPPRRNELVRRWVEERIQEVNQELPRHETIKKFCLSPQPLTVESGLLTASLKVKRSQVYQRFRAVLDALYE